MKQMTMTLMTAMLLTVATAHAALYTESFTANTVIPDGNPVGVALSGNVSDMPAGWLVSGLTVTLNISGGYDANLYAYLVSPSGTLVTLLNHPGMTEGASFGNTGSGMNLTLADSGTSIATTSDLSSGTYASSGSLSWFNSSSADGNWTLYFADTVSGGGTSTLNSWSLGITAVPEPVNVALGIFGGLFGVRLFLWKMRRSST